MTNAEALEFEQKRYFKLLAKFEALKGSNDDATAQILAGNSAQALKDLQRGRRVAAL